MIYALFVLAGMFVLFSAISAIVFLYHSFIKNDARMAQRVFMVTMANIILSIVFAFIATLIGTVMVLIKVLK